jgi:hypothetical protein
VRPIAPGRTPLRRGLRLDVRLGEARTTGTIDLVRPEELVVLLDGGAAELAIGDELVLSGAGISRVHGHVLSVDGSTVRVERPAPMTDGFSSRRAEPRIALERAGRLVTRTGTAVDVTTLDLSSGGARVALGEPAVGVALHDDVQLVVGFDDGREVAVRATVRFLGGGAHPELGLQFRLMSAASRGELLRQLDAIRRAAATKPTPVATATSGAERATAGVAGGGDETSPLGAPADVDAELAALDAARTGASADA